MQIKSTISAFLLTLIFGFTSCNTEETAQNESSTLPTTNSVTNGLTAKEGNCNEVPGWASQNGGTTGGGSAAETPVTTYAELKSAIENSAVKVIRVSGTITIPAVSKGRLAFKDQTGKTLYGVSGAKLVSTDQTKSNSGIINITNCKNIIIRNLIFEGPGAYDTDGWDNAVLDNCQNVWIDHCEFRDGVDGNLDFKNKSDFITVSYTKFQYLKAPKAGGPGGSNDHRFSNLIGSSDTQTTDRGTLRITFARCWWGNGCKQRLPRVRFGKIDIINSYFNCAGNDVCVAAGFEANIRIERSVFENVNTPIDLSTTFTAVSSIDNIFTNTTGNIAGKNTAFTPPYTIAKLLALDVKADITGKAGATFAGNTCGSF
ncbi:pectate lyase [Flavobacterium cheongpyeongense]|uniref:Pectate lyase n=1 Tax=Flavobacterium cheongpyeongense TaxID=2212651 RepID=A0A2V4BY07_9FLAO|nr:pectate lyase [Flavobacterium cheongpyeongense]PXY38864.1 pectate lyase [Flavobacterium cheongpyeongense]